MLQSQGALVLSDTSPSFARTNYYPNTGLNLTALHATYGEIYRNQVWVFVVVSKRARAVARLPLKVYKKTAGGRESATDTPYGRLLARPSPTRDPFLFWLWTSSTLDVYGEAMWAKIRGRNGAVAELEPVHPSLIQIRRIPNEQTGEVETYYAYLGGLAASVPVLLIPQRDIVHFRTYNPDTLTRGMSPLEPLRQTLVNEDAARRATSSFWANGARPGMSLNHPGTLSDPAARRLRAQFDDLHAGTDKTGSTVVLEEGMTAEKITLSAEEAQYIESRKLNREEVCAAYDVPPPVVHILDRATFSNITEQMRSMYRDTMAPHLGGIEATLDSQLRPEFDATGDLYAEFLMDEVLRGTFEERADKIQSAINSAQLTPNEGRALDNRPALDGGDVLYINSTMVPLTAERVPPPVRPPKSLSTQQVRSVLGRLGRYKSIEEVDADRLTAGLNGESEIVHAALATSGSIEEFRSLIKSFGEPEDEMLTIQREQTKAFMLLATKEHPVPVVNVDARSTVTTPDVTVTVEPPPPAINNVDARTTVAPPAPAVVTVNVPEARTTTKRITRDAAGNIATIEEN